MSAILCLAQARRKHFKGGQAKSEQYYLDVQPLAQARKYLSYRKAGADLKLWSGHGLDRLGSSAECVATHDHISMNVIISYNIQTLLQPSSGTVCTV